MQLPPALWQDKVLRSIPFSPEWSPPTATLGDCAPTLIARPHEALAPDVNHLPLILAEADSVSRKLICDLAQNWGYAALATTDGLEAFAAIRAQTQPALAVINRRMSGMNGIEICRATREVNRPVYIILVTERSGTEQLGEALDAGADDYLITPFDADELRVRLHVGARVIGLQLQLARALRDMEVAAALR